eukprot:gene41895-45888_t
MECADDGGALTQQEGVVFPFYDGGGKVQVCLRTRTGLSWEGSEQDNEERTRMLQTIGAWFVLDALVKEPLRVLLPRYCGPLTACGARGRPALCDAPMALGVVAAAAVHPAAELPLRHGAPVCARVAPAPHADGKPAAQHAATDDEGDGGAGVTGE